MTDRIDTDAIRAELPDQRIVRSNDEQAVWLLCDEVDRLRAARELSEDERVADLLAATPEPTLTGEETVNWYGLLRSAAAILPEVETPERLLVAARNLAADIDAALAPYPTSFYLPSAAPVPEGVPEDRIVPEGWRVEWHEIKPGHENCVLCIRWSKVPTLVPVSPSVDPEEG